MSINSDFYSNKEKENLLSKWIENPKKNPFTNNMLTINGPTYKKLVKVFDYDPLNSVKQRGSINVSGFTVSTLSDIYYKKGVRVLTPYTIYDVKEIVEFADGALLKLPNAPSKVPCLKYLNVIANTRNIDSLYGGYWNGKIPKVKTMKENKEAFLAYKIYSSVLTFVRKHKKTWEFWKDLDSDNISDFNSIPMLFYTDDYYSFSQMNIDLTKNVTIKKTFISVPIFVKQKQCGFLVIQKILGSLGDYPELLVYIKNVDDTKIEAAAFDPVNNGPTYVGNHDFYCSVHAYEDSEEHRRLDEVMGSSNPVGIVVRSKSPSPSRRSKSPSPSRRSKSPSPSRRSKSPNDCEQWLKNKNINPRTNRKILKTGQVFKNLNKLCNENIIKSPKMSNTRKNSISSSECDQWLKNKNVNPKTNRKILKTGQIYKSFEKKCNLLSSIKTPKGSFSHKNKRLLKTQQASHKKRNVLNDSSSE